MGDVGHQDLRNIAAKSSDFFPPWYCYWLDSAAARNSLVIAAAIMGAACKKKKKEKVLVQPNLCDSQSCSASFRPWEWAGCWCWQQSLGCGKDAGLASFEPGRKWLRRRSSAVLDLQFVAVWQILFMAPQGCSLRAWLLLDLCGWCFFVFCFHLSLFSCLRCILGNN